MFKTIPDKWKNRLEEQNEKECDTIVVIEVSLLKEERIKISKIIDLI